MATWGWEETINNLCPTVVVRHPTVSVRQEYGLHNEIEAMRLPTTPWNIGAAATLNIKASVKLNANMKLKIAMEKGMYHEERNDLKKHESNGEATADTVDELAEDDIPRLQWGKKIHEVRGR
jgi:hypothetical protein